MSRNPHIRAEQVEAIVNAIRAWNGDRITWVVVCKLAKPILGFLPSRSGVNSHVEIKQAYLAKDATLSLQPGDRAPAPSSLAAASRALIARDAQIAELKQRVASNDEKLDRWRYNAHLLGIKLEALEKPLPPISRKS